MTPAKKLSLLLCVVLRPTFGQDHSLRSNEGKENLPPRWDEDEPCFRKLGKDAIVLLDCLDEIYKVGDWYNPKTDASNIKDTNRCVNRLGPQNKGPASGLAAKYWTERFRNEFLMLAADDNLSHEQKMRLKELMLRFNMAEEDVERFRAERAKAFLILKQHGAWTDGRGYISIREFNFNQLQDQKSKASLAFRTIYGDEAFENTRAIFFNDENNPSPSSVVLEDVVLYPNRTRSDAGDPNLKEHKLEPKEYIYKVKDAQSDLFNEAKNYLLVAKQQNSWGHSIKRTAKVLTFQGAETQQDKDLEATYSNILKVSDKMVYELGIPKPDAQRMYTDIMAVLRTAHEDLEGATSKLDTMYKAAIAAEIGCGIIATAGLGSLALGAAGVAGGATLASKAAFGGVWAFGLSAGIGGGLAVGKAVNNWRKDGGGFWCNLGEEMAGAQIANAESAPFTVGIGVALPLVSGAAVARGLLTEATADAVSKWGVGTVLSIPMVPVAIENLKQGSALAKEAKALESTGHPGAAQAASRQSSNARFDAVYNTFATLIGFGKFGKGAAKPGKVQRVTEFESLGVDATKFDAIASEYQNRVPASEKPQSYAKAKERFLEFQDIASKLTDLPAEKVGRILHVSESFSPEEAALFTRLVKERGLSWCK